MYVGIYVMYVCMYVWVDGWMYVCIYIYIIMIYTGYIADDSYPLQTNVRVVARFRPPITEEEDAAWRDGTVDDGGRCKAKRFAPGKPAIFMEI